MQSVVTGQAPITYILPPPFNMHGILWGSSWMQHTLAVRRSDMLPVRTFGFLERRVLVPQAVGHLAVLIQWWWIYEEWCTVETHTSCWAVGLMPTTTCAWKLRGRRKVVSPFLSVFLGGCTPFCHPPFLKTIYTMIRGLRILSFTMQYHMSNIMHAVWGHVRRVAWGAFIC